MDFDIIDLKLIEAWTILTLAGDTPDKTIYEAMQDAKVPEKYMKEVEIKVAKKRTEELSQ